MKSPKSEIDIQENALRQSGSLLEILLSDHSNSPEANIIWATDSYEDLGQDFEFEKQILPDLVTGKHQNLIQPRASKSLVERRMRTKEKGEVFTPLKTVGKINRLAEKSGLPNKRNWQAYIRELRLEITCGEAPFIVTRYNPTAHTGKLITLKNRVGFLDRKLRTVSRFCQDKKNWLTWAKEAFKSSYGYEWQGDNVLLARENLLYTLIDFYQDKFGQPPALKIQEEFAEIISWNIFQMDGLNYVVPMSCVKEANTYQHELLLFEEEVSPQMDMMSCPGCEKKNPLEHNGHYAMIMDWDQNKEQKFANLLHGS